MSDITFDDASPFSQEQFSYRYLEVSTANTYFDTRLYSDSWEDASDADKLKALISATHIIDKLNFEGVKTEPNQTLEFPRNGCGTIPTAILVATCEIAFTLLDGFDLEKEMNALNTTGQTYAGIRETYDRGFAVEHYRAGVPSAVAWTYLKPYLHDPAQINLSRVS